jgi:UDP-N-acetylmuramoyl-L-alanyl-D-glutamate--2,6-diaminopimelate ligase
MKLRKLLSGIPQDWIIETACDTDPEISDLAYDSRKVTEGSLFFAIRGTVTDGHRFLSDVQERGAAGVVSELAPRDDLALCWVRVGSVRRTMAILADRFNGSPSRAMKLVGVTGTNGKTTTAYLVHSILNTDSNAVMMGTVETVIGDSVTESKLTTPESVDIQHWLRRGLDAGCDSGVVEVSSHALFLDRAYGCRFQAAVFTNLTQDHLDFHTTLEDYFGAKQRLFDPSYNPGLEHSIINGDDPFGKRLLEVAPGAVSFGLGTGHDVTVAGYRTSVEGTELEVHAFGRRIELKSSLVGRHNVYNILGATAACSAIGIEDSRIRDGLARLRCVPGRFEKVDLDRPFTVVVDYAHTPDALENVLRLARELNPRRLICVFGCGGDRDRGKRPLMGSIGIRGADIAIVTSDNPRTEDPDRIIDDIIEGVDNSSARVERITLRREAIRKALELAREGDLVLLAGKGHETYQDIGGRRIHFDEREIVREELCSI